MPTSDPTIQVLGKTGYITIVDYCIDHWHLIVSVASFVARWPVSDLRENHLVGDICATNEGLGILC
jgi:hypothetical protein